jgi:Bacterial regulatory proteins, luxR family
MLGISSRTVHHHLEHIYRKLHVTDRLSAVLRAQALGRLLPTGGPRTLLPSRPADALLNPFAE